MSGKSISKDRASKKVEIAVNKMVDLQDAGYGCDLVSRILEMLNELDGRILNSEQLESGLGRFAA